MAIYEAIRAAIADVSVASRRRRRSDFQERLRKRLEKAPQILELLAKS
jgi:hypothetical protein